MWHRLMQHIQGYYTVDATIGQVLALYWPGGQWCICVKVNFAGCFDGRGGAPVLYHAHRPVEKIYGFHKSHETPPLGKHSLQ